MESMKVGKERLDVHFGGLDPFRSPWRRMNKCPGVCTIPRVSQVRVIFYLSRITAA